IWNVLEENKRKLQSHFSWTKELITNKKTGSKLRFRTSNAKTKDGGRPGKVDFDEYHQYEDYKSIQVFKTGLGKKKNPRTTITTTNGDVREGPLDRLIERAQNILKGATEDNGLLPFICKLDDEIEVDNHAMWDKANPSLHYFDELMLTMQREYIDFKEDPVNNSSFLTKRMNIPRGNQDVEITSWENILATDQEIPDLSGCTCVAGIDFAKLNDFVTAGLLFKFKGIYYWLSHTWVCKKSIDLPRIKAPLAEWEKELGLLTFVDGPEIPPSTPAEWLAEQVQKYNISAIAIDNYRYTLLARSLQEVGFDTDKTSGANPIKLVRPSDQMKYSPVINSSFVTHNIVFGNNPLLRWSVNNACMITSKAGNVTFGKIEPKSRKTDPFMAMVAAFCVSENIIDNGETVDVILGCYTY
ncbi:MAG: terminase large subunit, partial [Bacillus sp. (in: Bacteria)]|nr:terminase large subunit [Bacillus sp. (in: firmicutes)]